MNVVNFLDKNTLALADKYVALEKKKSDLEELRPKIYEEFLAQQEAALLGEGDPERLKATQAEFVDIDQKILVAEQAMIRTREEIRLAIEADLNSQLGKFPSLKAYLHRREVEAAKRINLADQVAGFLRGSDTNGLQSILKVLEELRAKIKAIESDPESLDFGELKAFVGFLADSWQIPKEEKPSNHKQGTIEALEDFQKRMSMNIAQRVAYKANYLKRLPGQVIAHARKTAGLEEPVRKVSGFPWVINKINNFLNK